MTTRSTLVVLIAFALSAVGIVVIAMSFVPKTAAPTPAAAPAAAAAPAQPAGPTLATADTPVGTVVTEGGFTLYRFEKDSPKPPASNCVAKCATTWPPVLVDDGAAPAVDGVDPALVGTVTRADGGTQLTLKGWPLYRFSGDAAAGDTTGEGVGGTWFAIGVNGKPAKAG